MKVKFEISGMTCAACAARVEKAASEVNGVSQVQVNLLRNSMTLEAQEDVSGEVIAHITAVGYGARIAEIRGRYIANFGRSGEVGGQYLIDTVKKQIAARRGEA